MCIKHRVSYLAEERAESPIVIPGRLQVCYVGSYRFAESVLLVLSIAPSRKVFVDRTCGFAVLLQLNSTAHTRASADCI
jgi:hypothetical protein